MNSNNRISFATIRRLPSYLTVLKELKHRDIEAISSTLLANRLSLEPIQVRKDLASVGVTGQARIGFNIKQLIPAIQTHLGWNDYKTAYLVGAGNLGIALIKYQGFREYGLTIEAAFDCDVEKHGKEINNVKVLPIEKLASLIQRRAIKMIILTVPGDAAQEIVDLAVEAGINAIWNFTAETLNLPSHVVVENVNLAASLAVLSTKLADK